MLQTTTEEIKTSLRNVVWKFATGRVNMGEADQQIVGYLNQLIQQVKKEKDSECERRVEDAKKNTLADVLGYLDYLEVSGEKSEEDADLPTWRGWKRIRNAIVDHFKIKPTQPNEEVRK